MERYRFDDSLLFFMERSRIPFCVYQYLDDHLAPLAVTEGFCELFGLDTKEQALTLLEENLFWNVHPDDVGRVAEAISNFVTEGGKYEEIYRVKNRYMEGYHIVHVQAEHAYTDTGAQLIYAWYTDEGSYAEGDSLQTEDLNQFMNYALYQESVLKESRYDYLTGLPNMTWFFELANRRRDKLNEVGCQPAFLYMDFRGMKYFNRKYGFAEGDKLLQAFARFLIEKFGNENCSRLGQDHFGVVVDDRILDDLFPGFFTEVSMLNEGRMLSLHVGLHLHRLEEVNASTACDRAKLACDSLRGTFSSGFKYYDETMRNAEERKQYILANLDKAISERWIKVYYQPIVRALNGRVCDEEALARWIDPVIGFLSPADFIPILEEAKLIYKLDLYVLERVIEKNRILRQNGLHLVPQSINLSRSDFDVCDMVREICRRVDASGLPRSLFTIEITESIVGSELDFIRKEVDRFRENGFAVWMDDFGSGYSSLDVLQSIKFDLIKFDMRFMQKFDEGESGKIILTEMMRMAAALGVDTVCEGVETEAQVQFLRESGCSKLQGYYYARPMPMEQILERYAKGIQIGFENPAESAYFESIGRINLYDLTMIAQGEDTTGKNFFNSLPMAILEMEGKKIRFTRTNQSFRDFIRRFYGYVIEDEKDDEFAELRDMVRFFAKVSQDLKNEGNRMFIDELLPGNYYGHYFVRGMAENPVNGTEAIAVAVLSVVDVNEGATYANIARALAADYFDLYYVSLDTEEFIEYTSRVGEEGLATERHGENFFYEARKDALKYLYHEDRELFVRVFTKENVLRDMDKQGSFSFTYRLIDQDKVFYANMKAMRMRQDDRHIIIGVSNIDFQMKQKALLDKIHQDQITYSRIMALSGDYICMYTVDLDSDEYMEYNASTVYEGLGLEKGGKDFFTRSQELCVETVYEEDHERFLTLFTKENILQEIEKNGLFRLSYRLMIDGVPRSVMARVAQVKEGEKDILLVGVLMEEEKQG